MKQKLFSLFFAMLAIATVSLAQDNRAKNGCSTDCWFTDCTVSCPEGSIAKCKCVLGSFGSCGCSQMYRTTTAPGYIPGIRNEDKFQKVLDALNKAGLKQYAEQFSLLFKALKSKDSENYNKQFDILDQLAQSNREKAISVEKIVAESIF